MVETLTQTKKVEYKEHELTVVLVKRTALADRRMVGKSLLDWTSSAFTAFDMRVVESSEDAYTIACNTQTESDYIMVVDAQFPLLKKQDVREMFDYVIYKELEVGHFLCGTIYKVDALPKIQKTDPLFVVPIAEERATKVDNEYSLVTITRVLQERVLAYHISQGVRILSPDTTIIDCNVTIGKNVTIAPFVILTNETVVGDGCYIGAYTSINRSTLMPNVEVYASRLENVLVGEHKVVEAYSSYHDCEIK